MNTNCGIYGIKNKINSKIYIGLSKNIKKRISQHKCNIKNIGKFNTPIYNALRKYGFENFDFFIIENCEIEELCEKEKYWISYYNSTNDDFGYNLENGGTSNIVVSDKTRIKLHNSQKNKIPIVKLDMYGNYICRYDSINQCARENNLVDGSDISKMINGKQKNNHIKGFVYIKESDYLQSKYKITNENIIGKFNLKGELLEQYESMAMAGKLNNISSGNISVCCDLNKSKKIVGGFIWRRMVDYNNGKIKELPSDNEIIKNILKGHDYIIKLTDVETGFCYFFKSISEILKTHKTSMWAVRNSMYNKKLLLNRYKIEVERGV